MDTGKIQEEIKLLKNRIHEIETEIGMNQINENEKQQSDDETYIKVSRLMREIGIPPHILGHKYIRDAIVLIFKDKDLSFKVSKTLYPEIAQKNSTKSIRVERAIRHAIETIWIDKNMNMLIEVFGTFEKVRPTNTAFLASMVEYLSFQQALKYIPRDSAAIISS
jgi:two-component system response regulator (stage 0 sporulation protein A)